MKTVSVIGAGVAGLASAIRLQKLGYQVHIYEKNDKVGGKMHQIKGGGYTFDLGPTIVMMIDVYREIFEFAGKNPDDYIPSEKVEPMMDLVFSKEKTMEFSTDLVKLMKMLEGISKEDAQGYLEFLASIYKRYNIAMDHFLSRSFRKWTDFYNPKSLWNGLRLKTFNDAYSEIGKYVKDEDLKKSLAFQTLYIGISPYQGPSLYTIIPMIELFYGVEFIKGGMYSLAKGMEKLFLELGGQISLETEVKEIVIEGKEAKGIIVEGEFIESDYLVCGADFPYAMKHLIKDENKRGKYTDKKIDEMEYSCSCFLMYLGIDKKIGAKSLHTIHFAKDFQKNIDDIFKYGKLPEDPSYYIYVPSLYDESLAPDGKEAVYVLVPVPDTSMYSRWDEHQVQSYKKLIIDKIQNETEFTDLGDHIEFETFMTPNDFRKRFNAYNGATFGLRPSLKQSNYWRPHNKFDYADRLYFAGSSVHPGAGVPIVLQSAKLAVEELLRDDDQKR